MRSYKTLWTKYKGFIIGFDKNYLAYGVWQIEPNWDEFNCIGVYHKTIEEARQEIDNFINQREVTQ